MNFFDNEYERQNICTKITFEKRFIFLNAISFFHRRKNYMQPLV